LYVAEKDIGDMKFEEILSHVEGVVKALQEGNVPLEEALDLYEGGFTMLKAAQQRLEQARQKLEILKREAGGDEEAEG